MQASSAGGNLPDAIWSIACWAGAQEKMKLPLVQAWRAGRRHSTRSYCQKGTFASDCGSGLVLTETWKTNCIQNAANITTVLSLPCAILGVLSLAQLMRGSFKKKKWLLTICWCSWLLFGGCALIAYYNFDQLHFKDEPPSVFVEGKRFFNQEVVVDGKKFVGCSFDHCQMIFQGRKRFDLINNQLDECTWFFTKPEMAFMLDFQEKAGFLKDPVARHADPKN